MHVNAFSAARRALLAGLIACVAACGPPEQSEPLHPQTQTPLAAPRGNPAEVQWHAMGPSTFAYEGDKVRASLGGGYAYALFPNFVVEPGVTAQATVTFTGPSGRNLRVYLQRHCGDQKLEDAQAADYVLTGASETHEIVLTFQHAFPCVRVTFVSPDKSPLNLVVQDVRLVRVGH